MSVEIDDDHVLRTEIFIRNAAGLNDEEAFFTVNPAHIPPCKCDETEFRQKQICFVDGLFQIFQHYLISSFICEQWNLHHPVYRIFRVPCDFSKETIKKSSTDH